jgi:hypothetical protein
LGALGAVFEPLRDPRASYWSAVWSLRRADSLPWRGGGSHASERCLSELSARGYLTKRHGRSRTIGVAFTRAGLQRAFALIGWGEFDDVVVRDAVLRRAPPDQPYAWVPETVFAESGEGSELKLIQWTHLSALMSGLIESHCSTLGNIAYRVTSAERPTIPPGALDKVPKEKPGAFSRFLHAYNASIAWLNTLKADVDNGRDIGPVPLPLSAFAPPAPLPTTTKKKRRPKRPKDE